MIRKLYVVNNSNKQIRVIIGRESREIPPDKHMIFNNIREVVRFEPSDFLKNISPRDFVGDVSHLTVVFENSTFDPSQVIERVREGIPEFLYVWWSEPPQPSRDPNINTAVEAAFGRGSEPGKALQMSIGDLAMKLATIYDADPVDALTVVEEIVKINPGKGVNPRPGYVTDSQYRMFLEWFYPIRKETESVSADDAGYRISELGPEIFSQTWWRGFEERDPFNENLSKKPINTVLVRYSALNPGAFVFGVKNTEGSVNLWKFYRKSTDPNKYKISVDKDKISVEENYYRTIYDLAKAWTQAVIGEPLVRETYVKDPKERPSRERYTRFIESQGLEPGRYTRFIESQGLEPGRYTGFFDTPTTGRMGPMVESPRARERLGAGGRPTSVQGSEIAMERSRARERRLRPTPKATGLEERQRSRSAESDAVFGENTNLKSKDFYNELKRTYGADTEVLMVLINNLESQTGIVPKSNYKRLLDVFFPIRHQSYDFKSEKKTGYKLAEIANVLISPWWKGDMRRYEFQNLIMANPKHLFVRRSGSIPNAFVFGWWDNKVEENQYFVEDDNMIHAQKYRYRTVEHLYQAVAKALGLPI